MSPTAPDSTETKTSKAATAHQIELARHALGLPNKARRSYRNHFVAGPGHSDYEDWVAMVADGNARQHRASQLSGGDPVFTLTAAGAAQALKRSERLCPEDFPAAKRESR